MGTIKSWKPVWWFMLGLPLVLALAVFSYSAGLYAGMNHSMAVAHRAAPGSGTPVRGSLCPYLRSQPAELPQDHVIYHSGIWI